MPKYKRNGCIFVASVDADPESLHDVMFYAIVARTLAEVMGSAQPADYAEPHMRSLIVDGIKVGAAPFDKESEDVTWRSVKVQPAHVTLALRVQAKAVVQHAPPSASAIPGGDALAQVMQQYVQTQQAELDKGRKKGTLSYDLKARVKEVGLSGLPDLPTEDAMLRLESASKAVHAQGRQYVGSAEGEDLQVNFRPSWTRTPKLDVLVGDGSLEEKIRGALDARKQRSQQDRVDYLSYANFQGHVLDWGVKMVVTKVLDPVHLIGYQLVLTRVAEECGGRALRITTISICARSWRKNLIFSAMPRQKSRVVPKWPGGRLARVAMVCNLVHQRRKAARQQKAWRWEVLGRCVAIRSMERAWCQFTLDAAVRQGRQTKERWLG